MPKSLSRIETLRKDLTSALDGIEAKDARIAELENNLKVAEEDCRTAESIRDGLAERITELEEKLNLGDNFNFCKSHAEFCVFCSKCVREMKNKILELERRQKPIYCGIHQEINSFCGKCVKEALRSVSEKVEEMIKNVVVELRSALSAENENVSVAGLTRPTGDMGSKPIRSSETESAETGGKR